MLRLPTLRSLLRLVPFAFLLSPSYAALILRYDLQSVCYMSTGVVEAALVRTHQPGKTEWEDTDTATVLNSWEGKYKAGDQIKKLDLELYSPNQISRHCILFLAPAGYLSSDAPARSSPPQVVDMMLIDNKGSVHRYSQQSDPGLLVPDFSPQHSHPVLAEERAAILSAWTSARKLKAPPDQVLHSYQVLH